MTVCLGLFAGKHLGAQQVQTLDEVISQAARAVEAKLSQGSKLAILNFSSTAEVFSDYVIEELSDALVMNGKVTVTERHSLGAQAVMSGSLTNLGNAYRFRVKVIKARQEGVKGESYD
jgi:hypothetical protein